MSLLCRESDAGLHLILKIGDDIVPAHQYSLPDYLIERITFWNTWASDEFVYQYERIESAMYGLEAYAISIAADISACFPNYFVDYCGLPVHDEWATREYALKHSDFGRNWDNKFPPVPTEWSYNRTMKNLVRSVTASPCEVPPHGFVMHHDLDYGISEFHYDPASLPYRWLGYEESIRINESGGYPIWLVRHCSRMEIMHNIELEYPFDDTPSSWRSSDFIHSFLFDAISVDIARFSKRVVPISSSPRYVTGNALLELVTRLRSEKNERKGSNQSDEIITSSDPELISQKVFRAIKNGDDVVLRQLLHPGGRSNFVGDFGGQVPIHFAAKKGQLECIKVLLEHGADIHYEDDECETAITLASLFGHTECVRYLLRQGANVNDCAVDGTPLIYSAERGNIECIKLLLDRGANVNERVSYGITALRQAILSGSVSCVKLLVEHGAKVSTVADSSGFDEMMWAVLEGSEQCIQLVLAAGGKPDYVEKYREIALHDAVNNDNVRLVRELLSQGADVNFKNAEGETVLFRALRYATPCKCLPDILAAKPDETIRNMRGHTAWEKAAINGAIHGSRMSVKELRNMPFAEIEEKGTST